MIELFSRLLLSGLLSLLVSELAWKINKILLVVNQKGVDMKDRVIKRMWKHINKAGKFYLTHYANKDQILEFVKASSATLACALAVAKQHNLEREANEVLPLDFTLNGGKRNV